MAELITHGFEPTGRARLAGNYRVLSGIIWGTRDEGSVYKNARALDLRDLSDDAKIRVEATGVYSESSSDPARPNRAGVQIMVSGRAETATEQDLTGAATKLAEFSLAQAGQDASL